MPIYNPAVSGAATVSSYASGSLVIATGKFTIMTKRIILTGTQRLTVNGTGRLRIT